tara:strand:+ start:310 stop:489 length:180 start_codon:yes stop_codon:yes gene_type:complete
MTETEISFVKIQPRSQGRTFMITIPKEIVDTLEIIDNEKIKVYLDKEKRRIIYELPQLD